MNVKSFLSPALAAVVAVAGSQTVLAMDDSQYSSWPAYDGSDLELLVDGTGTHFTLWSPKADAAEVLIYDSGRNTPAVDSLVMHRADGGTWRASVPEQLYGKFYTFRVTVGGKQLAETPGVWAKAVGTNGERAAIIDFARTNPAGWDSDRGPELRSITDAVIYEMHHRDFSMHPSSGIVHKGKFLALTEPQTRSVLGDKTGIDHLKELGITHVHILPSYDYNSVDESNLPSNQYNWGYDPFNYNAPEGSYSTDPANPATRVLEMKQMVKALHDAGIGVVMDVVYNHTANNDESNFSLTAPGYYYRHRADGSYSDASGCGNETASEREQMRNFIINSVKYWADEYHIDGFRFDLMAIHDMETMNKVAVELKKINPSIFIYGEGWTAGDSPLPAEQRALKENVGKMRGVAVFSDDIRDAVKGHYSNAADRGFATGKPGSEETVKIGIVASTKHPQVDYGKGNNSKFPYASAPTQIINYVSCHDDLTLTDKLAASMPEATEAQRQRAARLAQTIVFTSQGTPFMFAGEELRRRGLLGLNYRSMAALAVFAVSVALWVFYSQRVFVTLYGHVWPLEAYIPGFAGTSAIFILMAALNRFPLLDFLGRNSLTVLCTHYMIFLIMENYIHNLWWLFACVLALTLVAVKFCITYFPLFTGRGNFFPLSRTHLSLS